MDCTKALAPQILDQTYDLLTADQVDQGMAHIIGFAQHFRQNHSSVDWEDLWQTAIAPHPVTALIHQDPFTHHSYVKPRGYAGDAELLDYIYGLRSADRVSAIGQKIFNFSINTAASASVRSRCEILAKTIDNTARAYTTPPHFVNSLWTFA